MPNSTTLLRVGSDSKIASTSGTTIENFVFSNTPLAFDTSISLTVLPRPTKKLYVNM